MKSEHEVVHAVSVTLSVTFSDHNQPKSSLFTNVGSSFISFARTKIEALLGATICQCAHQN